MALHMIHLTLARDAGHPAGDRHCGYLFVAPLDAVGHLDPLQWAEKREACVVSRFWNNETTELGRLVHTGAGWVFDYDPKGHSDDEPGFHFEDRCFRPGEYVSRRDAAPPAKRPAPSRSGGGVPDRAAESELSLTRRKPHRRRGASVASSIAPEVTDRGAREGRDRAVPTPLRSDMMKTGRGTNRPEATFGAIDARNDDPREPPTGAPVPGGTLAHAGMPSPAQASRSMIHSTSGADTKRHFRNGPAMTLR